MKKTVICGCLLLAACDREMKVATPDFEVVVRTAAVRPGEPVVFDFSGSADYISFYSGAPYADYACREGRTVTPGWETGLSFDTEITAGEQSDQLSVLVTDKFNGDYNDYDNLVRTDWTDITGWFHLADGKGQTPSTEQDLSAFASPGRPIYLAFRYRTRPQAVNGTASRWVVSGLKIVNRTEELGKVVLYDLLNAGFRLVDPFSRTEAASRTAVSQTQLAMQGNLYGPDPEGVIQGIDIETEHWVISRAMDMTSARDLGPDRCVSIKGFTQPVPSGYTHVYETPGVYDAVFVASCQSLEESREVVRTVRITVTNES